MFLEWLFVYITPRPQEDNNFGLYVQPTHAEFMKYQQ